MINVWSMLMPKKLIIQFMHDGKECFISRYELRHNVYLTYVHDLKLFYVHLYQEGDEIDEKEVPDYCSLSEEELFQENTISTEDVHEIKKYQDVLKQFHSIVYDKNFIHNHKPWLYNECEVEYV